jgi:hypothetical protein
MAAPAVGWGAGSSGIGSGTGIVMTAARGNIAGADRHMLGPGIDGGMIGATRDRRLKYSVNMQALVDEDRIIAVAGRVDVCVTAAARTERK